MNREWCCRALLLLILLAARAEAAGPVNKTRGYALLVGCTRYERLAESFQLQGPANDVLMVRDLLVERFGFPKDSVTILAEGSAVQFRPTRANIQREFQRLTDLARPGDQVVILLAGHGSQQPGPDPDNPGDPKALRMCKIFLPADVGKWDRGKNTVTNAITADDFHPWLSGIRKSGAYLWVIVDACHSGGMIRGAGEEVVRQVPPGVLIPEEVLNKAQSQLRTRAAQTQGPAEEDPGLGIASEEQAMVVVYAAQGSEVTVERTLPADSRDGKRRGLFTYTICQTLAQAARSLTYNELIQRVQAQYVESGRTFPTPLVQGKDRDREVLRSTRWPGRSQILLGKDEDGLKINAGAIQGLTKGTILATYPPPGQARGDKPLGYVRIVERQTLESRVDPCAYDGLNTNPDRLTPGGVCEPTVVDYGDLRLRVFVDRLDNRGHGIPNDQHQSLTAIVRDLSRAKGSLVRLVDEPRQADWLVRWDQGKIFLIPSAGVSASPVAGLPPLYGPVPEREPPGPWVSQRLTQIARVQNLKQLASSTDEAVRGDAGLKIGLEVRRLSSQGDRQGQPVPANGRSLTLHDGDRLLLRLTNPNRVPVDVTLLYVNGGFGIDALYPERGEINRLVPGETVSIRIRVSGKTTGQENLVAVVVRGTEGQPVDFTALAQPTLEAARGRERTRGGSALATPLGRLLEHAMFASGTTRSADRYTLDEYRLEMFSWNVASGTRER
jgi:hypothetical protein